MTIKRTASILAVAFAVAFIAGCQSEIESDFEITNSTDSTNCTEEIINSKNERDLLPKLVIDTDKPCLLSKKTQLIEDAENLYLVEKQDMDVSIFDYVFSSFSADGNYYCTEQKQGSQYYALKGITPVDKASIAVYNSETKDLTALYSEAPNADEHSLTFEIVGLLDPFLYYYRLESNLNHCDFVLCRLNLKDGVSSPLFSFANESTIGSCKPIRSGDYLYFYEVHDVDWEKSEGIWTIYRCDMNTGETSVFRDYAECPLPYKDGIIYYHNGGFYYHGSSSDITGEGIFYEGDELIFYPNSEGESEVSGINANGDTVFYTYDIYHAEIEGCAIGSVIGIFGEDYKRIDLGFTPIDAGWYINARDCSVSGDGLISVCGAAKPLIYDAQTKSFAVIFSGYSHYFSYASGDSICFFLYNMDENFNYSSAALYTVKRR